MTVDNIKIKSDVMASLDTVKDPEIDSVSVLDLGMIGNVSIENKQAHIKVLPTFIGCPALDIIEKNIANSVEKVAGIEEVHVEFVYSPAWTSDRITERGRERLKEFGIAPPPRAISDDGGWEVDCPYCGSTYTTMENLFGPTACRSILYCRSCKNPFEAMKPISTMM